MSTRPLAVGAGGAPSAHLVDLRALPRDAGSKQVTKMPEKFSALSGHNFLPSTVHAVSARLSQRLAETGWDDFFLGFLFLPPLLAAVRVAETIAYARWRTWVTPWLPSRALVSSSIRFVLLVSLVLLPLKLLFVAPVFFGQWKAELDARGRSAMAELSTGASALSQGDLAGAQLSFLEANRVLTALEASLGGLAPALARAFQTIPIVGERVGSKLTGVSVSRDISQAAVASTDAGLLLARFFGGEREPEILEQAKEKFRVASSYVSAAKASLERVSPRALPEDVRALVEQFRGQLTALAPTLEALPERVELMARLLGSARLMRYLVVFENNGELRPAGGFAGSFALLDVDRGKIKRLEVAGGGAYDLQGTLRLRVAAPEPLWVFRRRWEFQDTNWFSDWPSSAQTMMAFYEKGGGPTVDGAFMLTTTALEEFLGVLGPLSVPGILPALTKENAFSVLERAVENDHARKSGRPKRVLGSMAEALLSRLFAISAPEVQRLMPVVEELIRGRHLAVYLKDEQLERGVRAAGLGGEVRDNPRGDYLGMVSANIGGGKSDRVIEDSLVFRTRLDREGNIENTLHLRRTHTGRPGAPFVGVPNISYIRFYVARGSLLRGAVGFSPEAFLSRLGRGEESDGGAMAVDLRVKERPGVGAVEPVSRTRITEEFGKTVFGNWLIVGPGQTADVELTYRPGFSLPLTSGSGRYTLLVQKQPGTRAAPFRFELSAPPDFLARAAGSGEPLGAGEPPNEVPLDRDRAFGVLLQKS